MRSYKLVSFSLILIFVSLFLLPNLFSKKNNYHANNIRIKGSDTVIELVQIWTEKFISKNPEFNISIAGGGSGVGFAALINGTCDIVMSSRKIDSNEIKLAKVKNINPTEFEIGSDGLAVIINRNNPIKKLTVAQLSDIFTGEIFNWKKLGWINKKIVILSRENNSGTYIFFKNKILKKNNIHNEFSSDALMMTSSQAIYNEIAQNPNAIGYVSLGFVNNKIKSVSIKSTNGKNYILPTVQNVMNNTYPISRPLYIYTNGAPKGHIKKFINYILSNEGQNIILKIGFIPIKQT
ncbi:MAG: PstS family phosphate ABC transporter substrate-binding protein [Endomicrobium sp.]|jgi:phosphate transport system substrate-binding protein|nr:PstS family phosphate ABC transporter substrate-binding protein [Endomicrobium sp.]